MARSIQVAILFVLTGALLTLLIQSVYIVNKHLLNSFGLRAWLLPAILAVIVLVIAFHSVSQAVRLHGLLTGKTDEDAEKKDSGPGQA